MEMTVEATLRGVLESEVLPDVEDGCDRRVDVFGFTYPCRKHGPEPLLVIHRLDDLVTGLDEWLVMTPDVGPVSIDAIAEDVAYSLVRALRRNITVQVV